MPAKTPNQIVAYNLARIREEKGWNQDEVVTRLVDYGVEISRANYSLMETSWKREERIRNFDADLIAALAATFEVPIAVFYLPPEDDPDLVYRVGDDLTFDEWLKLAWPSFDITKSLDPDAGIYERRVLALAGPADRKLVDEIQASIEPAAAEALQEVLRTIFDAARVLENERVEVVKSMAALVETNRQIHDLLNERVTDPVWRKAIQSQLTDKEREQAETADRLRALDAVAEPLEGGEEE